MPCAFQVLLLIQFCICRNISLFHYVSFVVNAKIQICPNCDTQNAQNETGNSIMSPKTPKMNLKHTHTHTHTHTPLDPPAHVTEIGPGTELICPPCSRSFTPSDSKASTTKSALQLLRTVLTRITKNPDSTTLRQLPASDPKVRTFEAWPRVFKLFQQSGFVQSKDGKSFVLQVQYARILGSTRTCTPPSTLYLTTLTLYLTVSHGPCQASPPPTLPALSCPSLQAGTCSTPSAPHPHTSPSRL